MKIFQTLNHPVNDFFQYGYRGDLLVIDYSKHSRNRNLGIGIGQGKPLSTIFEQLKTIPEGYFTLQKLPKKLPINHFPILHFTQNCIHNPTDSYQLLMKLLEKL
jgi:glycerol-3-phosphate dehydrogenase